MEKDRFVTHNDDTGAASSEFATKPAYQSPVLTALDIDETASGVAPGPESSNSTYAS
ncbi:hypothetical protein [Sphingomonas baiyangensis]|uniref:hypothetical protein n=1 Tax=Sphingomonas baiyangensis TaxID=2572576 RepID=UPI002015F750|nr:hypothetical protein [Sphingomonas baiyangensis]